MVKVIGSRRRKTKHKFRKDIRNKGKISLKQYLQTFELGDKVCLTPEPGVQKGIYHARFVGRIATVKARQGDCYEVSFVDHSKEKSLIVHPIHLRRIEK